MSKDAGAQDAPKKGKAKIVIIAAAFVLLLASGGAGAWALGLFGGEATAEVASEGEAGEEPIHDDNNAEHSDVDAQGAEDNQEEGRIVFVDLPDVLVNLQSDSRRPRFLKLRVALETFSYDDGEAVRKLTPRILDSFQIYLRALGPDDVQGALGLQRLKEDMLTRINLSVAPEHIDNILIKEMLVQ